MAVFDSHVHQRDFPADVQYSGQRDRRKVCGGGRVGGGGGVLSDHHDIYGDRGGQQYRLFRHHIEFVRCKKI